ncbi:uncharacterized protein KGF55_005600 [Candida pseudojiufengensis]|uniref:uncharacterized protein n=1 Tax=Candida pseudojiufengensis TaxID=497109 RepID=UPI002224B409|nr:uncharacterized protein KGF55_005600 [Candida pseudojiufengensis]KAI5958946.1 hypothetical protein KGF55_005600 [Candida pseudojiufengensis]
MISKLRYKVFFKDNHKIHSITTRSDLKVNQTAEMGDTIDVRSKPSNVEAINRHISVLSQEDRLRFYQYSNNIVMENLLKEGYKDLEPFNYNNAEKYKIAIDYILELLDGIKNLLPSKNDYKLSKKDFTDIDIPQLFFSHDPEECIEEIGIVDKILLDAFGRPDKISLRHVRDYLPLNSNDESRQKNRLRFHDIINFVNSEYYKNPHVSIMRYFKNYYELHKRPMSIMEFLRLDSNYKQKFNSSNNGFEKFLSKFNNTPIFLYHFRIMVHEGLSECFCKTLSMIYEEEFKPLNDEEKDKWEFPEFNVIVYKFNYCTPGFKEEWRKINLPLPTMSNSEDEENNENYDNNYNPERIGNNNRVTKPINIAKRKFLERQARRRQRAIDN